jgi:nucleoside-diphosphate-sugar epimerase
LVDWTGKRVLVTGTTGFIGHHLVHRLAGLEAQVYAGTPPGDELDVGFGPSRLPPRPLAFDVRDSKAVQRAVDEATPEIVFSLAAVGVTNPAVDPMLALLVNTGGVVNLLEALRGSSVRRVLLVGTSHEYGAREGIEGLDPFNAYAASKVAAWAFGRMYWRAWGLPVVSVRLFQVYGPGQASESLIPATIRAALSGDDFAMTPGDQERDFVYVRDVVDGMLATAKAAGIEGASLDLGTGAGRAIRHVVERIWQLTNAKGRIQLGALSYRPGEAMHLVADADRTARLTGWRATTPLDEGLRATLGSLATVGSLQPKDVMR